VISWATRFKNWRRDHKHLTQPEFARALGVSLRTVKAIELEESRPSRMTKLKFKELEERHHARKTGSSRVKW